MKLAPRRGEHSPAGFNTALSRHDSFAASSLALADWERRSPFPAASMQFDSRKLGTLDAHADWEQGIFSGATPERVQPPLKVR